MIPGIYSRCSCTAKMSMFCRLLHSTNSSRRPSGSSVLVLRELIIVPFLQRTMRGDVSFVGLAPFPSGNAHPPIRQMPSPEEKRRDHYAISTIAVIGKLNSSRFHKTGDTGKLVVDF